MYKVIAIHTKLDAEDPFFCDTEEYLENDIVLELHKKAAETGKYHGIEEISADSYKKELAMLFDSKQDFEMWAYSNMELLEERKEMINTWCEITGHGYDFYFVEA
jgi:hypothetical protein